MPTASEVWLPLVEKIQERAVEYERFHAYWLGENDLPIQSTEFQSRFGTLFADYRDNLARPIIKSAESRVRVVGFGDGQGLATKAQEVWDANLMNLKSQYVHVEAMVKGDGYVIVLPKSDGTAGIWPQISESCAILYDEVMPDEKVAAMKWWVTDIDGKGTTKTRVNVYFKDRIERYISTGASETLNTRFESYEPYTDEGDFSTKHKVGEVPMFELNANYDLAEGRGRSDLADAAGPIDAINKTMLDMMTASEFTAAPQRYATGVEIPLDPKTGEPLEAYQSGKQKLWTAPNEQAKFGQFTAGDMKGYSDAVEVLVDHLSFATATPSYSLMKTAQYPSGEALRSAEAPLRGRVSDHQDAFGPSWQKVVAAAIKIDDLGEEIKGAALKQIEPKWLPVNAPFATAEFMEELKVKAEVLGVPEEKLWQEAGYTAAEIQTMLTMREEEAALGVDEFNQQAAAIVNVPAEGVEDTGVVLDTTPEGEEVGGAIPPVT